MDILTTRYCIVFNSEGLDRDWIKEDLSNYGKVIEINDYEDDGDNMTVFFMESNSILDFVKVKTRYNCLASPDNRYVLWPMAEGEKEKAEAMLAAM